MSFTETLQGLTGKPLADCTNQELYLALLELVRQKSADRVQPVTGRKYRVQCAVCHLQRHAQAQAIGYQAV